MRTYTAIITNKTLTTINNDDQTYVFSIASQELGFNHNKKNDKKEFLFRSFIQFLKTLNINKRKPFVLLMEKTNDNGNACTESIKKNAQDLL